MNRGQGAHRTSLQHLMKRPSAIFMMLALWMEFTRLRPLSLAYLNAYSATLVLAFLVMTCTSESSQQARHPCTGAFCNELYKSHLRIQIRAPLTRIYHYSRRLGTAHVCSCDVSKTMLRKAAVSCMQALISRRTGRSQKCRQLFSCQGPAVIHFHSAQVHEKAHHLPGMLMYRLLRI